MPHATVNLRRRLLPVLAALALLALPACASIAGTHQVISIDSPQRGWLVRDATGTALGQTPLFARIERERSHELLFARPGQRLQAHTVRCAYRLLGSLLPNGATAALALANPPAALVVLAVGNGIDVATGAAWDCPANVVLPDQPTPTGLPAAASPTCPLYVVAPPKHDDDRVSRELADAWWQRHSKGTCDRRVEPDESDKVLRRQGVTNDNGLDMPHKPRAQLNELGLRTGATHLAVLDVRQKADDVIATPVTYDLHTLAQAPDRELKLTLDSDKLTRWQRVVQWTGRHVQLLPDSIGFAPSDKHFAFQPTGGNQTITDQPTASWLPALASNWTLLSVDHPGPYDPWDLTGHLGPQLMFGYASQALRYGPLNAAQTAAVATMLEAGALFGPTGTLHTPLGALSGFLGLGVAGAWHWHDGHFQALRVPVVASANVAWTAFVTENLFVRGDITSYSATKPQVIGPGYSLTQWNEVGVTLGWYAPEWRQVVRGWF